MGIKIIKYSDNKSEIFCLRYSPDGEYLAAGCGDGTIKIYKAATGKESKVLNTENISKLPLTSIRFRPDSESAKTKNVILAVSINIDKINVDSDGEIDHWHLTSGKKLHTIKEPGNELYCVDYRQDGLQFVTAGKDYKIRVYDENTKTVMSTLSGGYGKSSPGHSNRVFSLKYHPNDQNILVSAGWDNTVQIWDVRVETSVRYIYGPHVCGDSVDIKDNLLLVGSYRPENQLELYDFTSGTLVRNINWTQSNFQGNPCMLYTAQFSKTGFNLVAAGGSGSNETKVFDCDDDYKIVGTISGLQRGVYTIDFSPIENKISVGSGDNLIRTFSVIEKYQK